MKKYYCFAAFQFLLLAFLNFENINAQQLDWVRTTDSYSKQGAMIARDANDNVVSCGYLIHDRMFTRKWDKLGNFLWEKESVSEIFNYRERPTWISTDNSNNIITLGYRYYGTSYQQPNAIVILKYMPDGTLLFKKTIEGVFGPSLRCELDPTGNIYIGAAANITGQSDFGFNLIKLDPNGNILFISTHNFGSYFGVNNMRYRNGYIALTGITSLQGYTNNCTTALFDANGNYLWGVVSNSIYAGIDVEVDNSGNVYVVNTGFASGLDNDMVVTKYSVTGTVLFTYFYDNNSHYESPSRINIQPDGNMVISGVCTSPVTGLETFKLSSTGSLIWEAFYSTPFPDIPQLYFMATNPITSEVFLTGTTSISGNPASVLTIKYNASGNESWVSKYDSTATRGMGLAIASDGSAFVVGLNWWTVLHYLNSNVTNPCSAPFTLPATGITASAATVNWSAISGAISYSADYKTSSSTTWINAATTTTNTFANLSGLSPSTIYDWRVRANCVSASSNYSQSGFTTTAIIPACPGPYDVGTNNTTSGAAVIPLNTDILGTISVKNENDYYQFKITTGGTISLTLTNLAANYQLSLLSSSGTQLAISQNNGTTNEAINNFKVAAGTYYARVFPKGNVFNASVCYKLRVQTGTALKVKEELSGQGLEITIYPNPVKDQLDVKINRFGEPVMIEVLDIYGRKIISKTATQSARIEMGRLFVGIYFVRVVTRQGKLLWQEKIMKE